MGARVPRGTMPSPVGSRLVRDGRGVEVPGRHSGGRGAIVGS